MSESAFAVDVPEAESAVSRLREQHDPSAALGAPAHITVLYPFMPPNEISAVVLERAQAALRSVRQFEFRLDKVARLPGVLYLAPQPAEPFVRMTAALVAAFPAYPPYRGRHATVVPHLTVAQAAEPVLDELEPQLRALVPGGGIHAVCRHVTLIENSSGRWQPMHAFDLDGVHGTRG